MQNCIFDINKNGKLLFTKNTSDDRIDHSRKFVASFSCSFPEEVVQALIGITCMSCNKLPQSDPSLSNLAALPILYYTTYHNANTYHDPPINVLCCSDKCSIKPSLLQTF